MKPSDFSLGLRQILGVLLPGSLWLFALALPTSAQFPLTVFVRFGAQQIFLVIGAAFLLGYAARGPAFSTGIWLGDRAPRRKRDRRRLQPTEETKQLLQRVATWVGTQEEPPPYSEQELLTWAKYAILGRSELSRRLDELEAEINLYATMVLPLLVSMLMLGVFWYRNPDEAGTWADRAMIIATALGMTVSFAARTGARRQSEVRDLCLMFLALAELNELRTVLPGGAELPARSGKPAHIATTPSANSSATTPPRMADQNAHSL